MRKPKRFQLLPLAAAVAMLGMPGANAANVNWIGPNGSFWDLLGNWNPGLPQAGDDVLLGASDTEFRTGNLTIRSFTGTGLLRLSGGQLRVTAASSIGSLNLTSGTLGGTGTVTISGLTTWNSGTMTDAGITQANGGMSLGDGTRFLSGGRVLNTAGTTTWSGATSNFSSRMLVSAGSTINNSGTWLDQNTFTSDIASQGGAGNAFNNSGTYTKSGASITSIGIAFNNSGTVNVNAGTLQLGGGGTSSGGFTGAGTLEFNGGTHSLAATAGVSTTNAIFSGGTNTLAGSYNVAGTTTVSGGTTTLSGTVANSGGALVVSSGSINFSNNAGVTVSTLNQTGGTIGGTQSLTVSGLATWNGGTMTDAGSTTTSGGMTLGVGTRFLSGGRVLNTGGTTTWSGANGNFSSRVLVGGGSTINNSGTWLDQNTFTSDIASQGGAGNAFNNSGTYTKSGASITSIGIAFNNSGTVNVNAGTLQLGGGGTSSGGFAGTGTLEFNGGTHSLAATAGVSTTNVIFSGGTNTLAGSYNVAGTTTVSGGTTTLSGTVANSGGALVVSSGTINFSNNAGVSVSSLNLSSGTVGGTQSLSISGLTTWNGGSMADAGTTTASGGMTLGNGTRFISGGRVLNTAGTTTWSGANGNFSSRVLVGGGSTINNSGTWLDQNTFTSDIVSQGGAGNAFNNSGTYTKSGAASTQIGITFNNTGTVNVNAGTLALNNGGTSSGSFTGAGTLEFGGGTHSLTAASSLSTANAVFSGGTHTIAGSYNVAGSTTVTSGTTTLSGTVANSGGALTVSGGTINFSNNAGVSVSSLNLSSGTVGGTQSLSISGLTTWNGGSMADAGTTNASGGMTLGNGTRFISGGRVLNTAGTTTWSGSTGSFGSRILLAGSSTINNNGTWLDQNTFTSDIASQGGSNTFNNVGTYTKSGAAITQFGVAFNNSGTVNINAGTLTLNNGGTSSGSFTGAGTLELGGGINSLTAASGVSTTNVVFSGGTNSLAGSYNAAGSTTVSGGTTNLSGTVTNSGGSLVVTNGTINFNNNAGVSVSTLDLSSGTVGGTQSLVVSGLATWASGTMSGGGSTSTNGGMTLSNGTRFLSVGRVLNTAGTTTWSGATSNFSSRMLVGGGSTINNSGTWLDQNTFTSDIASQGGSNTFNNTGTYTKSGAALTQVGIAFNNTGNVNVNAGTLSLNGGGASNGTFTVATGATLEFGGGTHALNSVTTSASTGTIVVSGGTVNTIGALATGGQLQLTSGTLNAGGATSAASYTQTGGTLGGMGTVTISGLASWNGGAMSDAGITQFNGGLALGNGTRFLNGGRVVNTAGTTTWSGATSNFSNRVFLAGGSAINNSGTWLDQNTFTTDIASQGGSNSFNNLATYTKSGAATTSVSGIAFNNTGSVNVNAGTLALNGGGTSSGSFTAATGATLEFGGGTHALNSVTASASTGTIAVVGGTVNTTGALATGGRLQITGGTLNAGGATSAASYTQSGGTLGGTGTVTISGLATWDGGTMADAGITNAIGGMALGIGSRLLNGGRVLNAGGTTTWSGATGSFTNRIFLGGGSTLNNNGTWLDQNGFSSDIGNQGGSNSFNNFGTYTKSGAATTSVNIAFNTSGAINVNAGTLRLDGGGVSSGSFNVASGARLEYGNGTHAFNNVTAAASTGTIAVVGGTVNTTGAFATGGLLQITSGTLNAGGATGAATYLQAGGTLGGTGTVTISGLSTWTGGTMTGLGTTVASGGMVLSDGGRFLSGGRVLNTAGTTTWSGASGNFSNRVFVGDGSSINNNGTWLDQNTFSSDIANQGGGNSFNNFGTYTKSGAATTSVNIAFNNSGSVQIDAGLMSFQSLQGTGTLRIAAGAAATLTASNTTVGTLLHNGSTANSLDLGARTITVSNDYDNAGFGVGNLFNRRANINITGAAGPRLLAAGDTNQGVSGANVSNGGTATPTLTIGNVRVGSTTYRYDIANTGSTGPALRGAIQTSVGGANISDGRLSGSGVTAGNWGPVATGGTLARDVTITVNTAGVYAPISGQSVNIVNNFENTRSQLLSIGSAAGAAAYNPAAAAAVSPSPVQLANQRVGTGLTQALTVANTAPAGAFSERLDANFGALTGHAVTNGGGIALLAAGGSDSASMRVGVDASVAGARSGSVTINFASNGTGTSGLPLLELASQQVNVAGNVYQVAQPTFANTSLNLGNVRVGSVLSQSLSITNANIAPAGFQEGLDASFSAFSNGVTTAGAVTNLAAGAASNALVVGFNTATAGSKSGSATVSLFSNGTGTSGLSSLSLGTQVVNINGTVYNEAVGAASPSPVNLGNFRVGQAGGAAPQSQNVAVSNTVAGPFTESLGIASANLNNAAFTLTNNLGSALIAAGGSNATALNVARNGGTAGLNTGTLSIQYTTDGAGTSGLAAINANSQNVTVNATGYNVAAGAASPSPVNLGNFRVGQAGGAAPQSQNVAVSNTVAGPFTESLGIASASVNNAAFTLTNNLGSGLIAAGGSNATALNVARSGGSAGLNTGTLAIQYSSDGAGTSGLAAINVNSQNITVNATGFNTAAGAASPSPINLGNFRVGQAGGVAPQSQNVAVANTVAGPFTESLGIASASVSNSAFTLTNNLGSALIAAGASNAAALNVARSGGSAGLNTGTLAIQYTSDGTGTSGLAAINVNSQNVTVNATGFNAAVGAATPSPIVFANMRVGAAHEQALTIANNAASGAFSEDLRATFGSASGNALSNSGSVASLTAGGSNATAMRVSLDNTSAGAKSGTVTVNFDTLGTVAGASNGLGTASVGSQVINVSGNVYQIAQPNPASLPATVNLGNFRAGSGAQGQTINIANTSVAAAAFQEGLAAVINGTSGAATGSGFANAAAGASGALQVGLSGIAAGNNSGTVRVQLQSNGTTSTGSNGLGSLNLGGEQTVTVNGTGWRLASTNAQPVTINFGNVLVGSVQSQFLNIQNTAVADGFSERLDAFFRAGGTTGDATNNGGSISLLAAGASSSNQMSVGISTATIGGKSGQVVIGYNSNGSGTSGLGVTGLPDQTIALTANIQANVGTLAQPGAVSPNPVNFGNLRVGAAPVGPVNLSISNLATVGEGLNASIATASAGFSATGSFTGLGPQATNNSALRVSFSDTASAGAKSGVATVTLVSDGTFNGGTTTDLTPQQVQLSANVFRLATGNATGTPVNLGAFRVGGAAPAAQSVSVTNTASTDGFSEQLGIQSVSSGSALFTATNTLGSARVNAGATATSAIAIAAGTGLAAGANNGSVTVQFLSDGTASGSGNPIASNSQQINVSATGFNAAVGSSTPTPVTLANQRVGGSASQVLTVANTATAGAFSEDLRASFGANGGAAINNGGVAASVLAGASNGSAMSVRVDTSSAGAKTGTVTIDYQTLGTVNGVATGLAAASAGSQVINVSGNVYNAAVGATTPTPVVVGNQRVGGSGSVGLTVANTAAAGAFSEDLRASFGANGGAAVNNGAIASGIVAGGSAGGVLSVGVNTATSGAKAGTVQVNYETLGTVGGVSNGLGVAGANAAQTINVSGNVYQVAAGALQTPALNFGTLQVGQQVSQNLVVRNTATGASGFVEDLNARFGASGNSQITGVGSFSGIAAGNNSTASNGSMVVTVTGASQGALNSAIAVNYFSAGAVAGVSNGLGELAVGSENFGVSGTIQAVATVINQASPQVNNPTINLGAVRVGGSLGSANVSVTNVATAAPQAALNASIAAVAGPITPSVSGSFNLLAPGATDNTSLTVGLSSANAGNFTGANAGKATLSFVSDASNVGNCGSNCQLSLGTQTVNIEAKVYTQAIGSTPTASLNFGIVRVGDTVSARNIVVNNTAQATALNDTLNATASGTSGPVGFQGGNGVSGIGAQGTGNIGVVLSTASAGTVSQTASVAFTSHNADMADVSAGAAADVAIFGQVNNYANAHFNKAGGMGSLSLAGSTYYLDYGTLALGDVVSSTLNLENLVTATGPQDELSGQFDTNAAGGLTLMGFNAFSGLLAGASTGPLAIDWTASGAGFFTRTITFNGFSVNADDALGVAQLRTLVLRANVFDPNAVPLPGTLALVMLGGLAGWLAPRRQRAMH